MDRNCSTCEYSSHFNGSGFDIGGFKCINPHSDFFNLNLGGEETFFILPKQNCKDYLIRSNIMLDYLQKNFDKIVNIIENKKGVNCMTENKITGLNENVELNKIVRFEKPIVINGVKTYCNSVYITFENNKFRLNVYSDTNSVHVVDTIEYDCDVSAMNVIEKECCTYIEIYTKFE